MFYLLINLFIFCWGHLWVCISAGLLSAWVDEPEERIMPVKPNTAIIIINPFSGNGRVCDIKLVIKF